jgi:hypothetical protein
MVEVKIVRPELTEEQMAEEINAKFPDPELALEGIYDNEHLIRVLGSEVVYAVVNNEDLNPQTGVDAEDELHEASRFFLRLAISEISDRRKSSLSPREESEDSVEDLGPFGWFGIAMIKTVVSKLSELIKLSSEKESKDLGFKARGQILEQMDSDARERYFKVYEAMTNFVLERFAYQPDLVEALDTLRFDFWREELEFMRRAEPLEEILRKRIEMIPSENEEA